MLRLARTSVSWGRQLHVRAPMAMTSRGMGTKASPEERRETSEEIEKDQGVILEGGNSVTRTEEMSLNDPANDLLPDELKEKLAGTEKAGAANKRARNASDPNSGGEGGQRARQERGAAATARLRACCGATCRSGASPLIFFSAF
eukprot:TRINITY_DN22222_c0_g1_i1.p1 TRINITY_DN22222_c0_g1~~TRINITY_DN22222_c0_g1_i1.p1  ORF type:complete len:145 (-),score=40.93 TRINITY_DN22222_c0_g1_i1:136-570(-)